MRKLAVVVLGLSIVAIGGCSSAPALPAPRPYGPTGQRFVVSSFQPLDQRTSAFRGTAFQPQYGTAVASRTVWVGGGVNVWVDALRDPVPSKRILPFLRSYLPVPAEGGRVIRKWGMPAATQTLSCFDPSGPCPGFVGALVVLESDHMVYDVFTHQPDRASVRDVLDSLRIPAAEVIAG